MDDGVNLDVEEFRRKKATLCGTTVSLKDRATVATVPSDCLLVVPEIVDELAQARAHAASLKGVQCPLTV